MKIKAFTIDGPPSVISMLLHNSARTLSVAKFTEHAKLKMRERQIKLSDDLSVVERPSAVFYDTITGCNIALAPWRSSPRKQLLVSYVSTDDEVKIITLFVLSKPQELIAKREKSGRWLRIKQN
jgi:hypothetical protein